ncbi:MAG TPA: hypothetical protein VFB23_09270 [Candidatus Acidoferrales bacterium]|jgi:hypothetical protein|nr:hypothetical protein [Candidatus Acidoferrales bacterium]
MSQRQNEHLQNNSNYSWQQTVQDVFRASPASLSAKIRTAQKIMTDRLNDGELGVNERAAIKDALSIVRILAAEAHTNPPPQPRRKPIAS